MDEICQTFFHQTDNFADSSKFSSVKLSSVMYNYTQIIIVIVQQLCTYLRYGLAQLLWLNMHNTYTYVHAVIHYSSS